SDHRDRHSLPTRRSSDLRVKKGKQRGYVVDYVGLTHRLTEALTLYATTDEQQELVSGLKNITSEVPVLQERYQRLLQLFAEHKRSEEHTSELQSRENLVC